MTGRLIRDRVNERELLTERLTEKESELDNETEWAERD